MAIDR